MSQRRARAAEAVEALKEAELATWDVPKGLARLDAVLDVDARIEARLCAAPVVGYPFGGMQSLLAELPTPHATRTRARQAWAPATPREPPTR